MKRCLPVPILAALAPLAAHGQSLSYQILLDTDVQSLVEDTDPVGPLQDDLLDQGPVGSAQGTVFVDYGEIVLTAGSDAEGNVLPAVSYQANPLATFEDDVTISAPGLAFAIGTFRSRLELSVTGGAVAGGAEVSNTRSRYSLSAEISTCQIGCDFIRSGEWFDFGFGGGGAGFSGDPVASIDVDPIEFAFDIAFPVTVSLSLETQATADDEVALAETFGDASVRWFITEVRSGEEVVDAAVAGASGVSYLPEPGAELLAAAALLGLAATPRPRTGARPQRDRKMPVSSSFIGRLIKRSASAAGSAPSWQTR